MKKQTWIRGRKKSSPEHQREMQEWQKTRVKIINLVARKTEIEKKCCICGKPGKIIHNKKDPYYITFLCDECKKDKQNRIIAEESRFDLRTKLNINNIYTSNFSDEEIVRFVLGYMNDKISIGEYCENMNITRYKFDQLINRYKELFPKQNIRKLIKEHSRKIQNENMKKSIEDINNNEE